MKVKEIEAQVFLIIEEEVSSLVERTFLNASLVDYEKLLANIQTKINKLLEKENAVLVHKSEKTSKLFCLNCRKSIEIPEQLAKFLKEHYSDLDVLRQEQSKKILPSGKALCFELKEG